MTTTDSRSAATTGEGVNAGLGNPEGRSVDESGTEPQGGPRVRPAALGWQRDAACAALDPLSFDGPSPLAAATCPGCRLQEPCARDGMHPFGGPVSDGGAATWDGYAAANRRASDAYHRSGRAVVETPPRRPVRRRSAAAKARRRAVAAERARLRVAGVSAPVAAVLARGVA